MVLCRPTLPDVKSEQRARSATLNTLVADNLPCCAYISSILVHRVFSSSVLLHRGILAGSPASQDHRWTESAYLRGCAGQHRFHHSSTWSQVWPAIVRVLSWPGASEPGHEFQSGAPSNQNSLKVVRSFSFSPIYPRIAHRFTWPNVVTQSLPGGYLVVAQASLI